VTDSARVLLWGRDIGAVTWLPDRELGVFQYTPEFARSAIQLSPLMMPLTDVPYSFPSLSRATFRGLPGLLADSLPDTFGNTLINAWLSQRGRDPASFTPVERLCYTGSRGMGALEFKPLIRESPTSSRRIDIAELVALADRVLDDRIALHGKLTGENDRRLLKTFCGWAHQRVVRAPRLCWRGTKQRVSSGQDKHPQRKVSVTGYSSLTACQETATRSSRTRRDSVVLNMRIIAWHWRRALIWSRVVCTKKVVVRTS